MSTGTNCQPLQKAFYTVINMVGEKAGMIQIQAKILEFAGLAINLSIKCNMPYLFIAMKT